MVEVGVPEGLRERRAPERWRHAREHKAIERLPVEIQGVVRQLLVGKGQGRRRDLLWVAKNGAAVLSRLPADILAGTIEHLVERNRWLLWRPTRIAPNALKRDLARVEKLLCAPVSPTVVQEVLLDAALPAPDRRDRLLIKWAIGAQVVGAAAVVLLSHVLKQRVVDWVIFAQAVALLVSTVLIVECRHVDGRGWGRFMSAATLINLVLSGLVLFIS